MTEDLLVEVAGELDLALEDLLVDGHWVLIIEWIDSSNHLVRQNSESPPVNWLAVTFIEEHLWGQILWGTAKSVGSGLAVFGKSEVCQFQVALLINQNILWLQISVNNVQRVQILEHEGDLGRIKPITNLE